MESIINQKQKFITTKEDKLNHGIGLENVRRTVKKYDEDMRISQENERFIVFTIYCINKYIIIGKKLYKKVITMSFIPKKCRSYHSDCFFCE